MNRHWIRSLEHRLTSIKDRWYVRPFSGLLTDSRLWTLQRRSITSAFAAGLAICFIPLPVHVPVAVLVSIGLRLNLPVAIATVMLVNPLTVVPIYYLAYRVGAIVLGVPPGAFEFSLSWDWLQHGLGELWQPFLAGCAICALLASGTGWFVLEWIWRHRVRQKYRLRARPASGESG